MLFITRWYYHYVGCRLLCIENLDFDFTDAGESGVAVCMADVVLIATGDPATGLQVRLAATVPSAIGNIRFAALRTPGCI